MKDSCGYCTDCGTRYSDGLCPNCHHDAHLYETQYEYLPEVLSEEFVEKVVEQLKHKDTK